ncbi:MAG: helix-turn-helix transcriptional regulator [Thermoleophilia bacterium]
MRAAAGGDMSKDEVAEAVGIGRRLAGFHLDKLVEHGFLDCEFRRDPDRRGPGAGRPPKRYRVAASEPLPPLRERRYDLLASLLLRATQGADGGTREALQRVGYDFGLEIGRAEVAAGRAQARQAPAQALADVARVLSRYGFEASVDAEGGVRACACPFEELAFDDPGRICNLDRAIWRGMLAALTSGATLRVSATRAEGDEACVATMETAAH